MADADRNLKAHIRRLGVANVARRAGVPATTLYSFCSGAKRQVGHRTFEKVQKAVAAMVEGRHDG